MNEVARAVTKDTERGNVAYQAYIIDSPIVNAFALPGGYLYVSRGLLALAGSEAELAAVLGHETGHVTARHSAERYSHGVLASLGAAVLSSAVNAPGLSQALGVGQQLYINSYSREQENEADSLGLRYMSRGGYDTHEMSVFLKALQNESALESRMQGQKEQSVTNYFSTHPATAERVAKTAREAASYPPGGAVSRDRYLSMIDGLTFGDSERQGFVQGQRFYHPGLGFAFDVPQGFRLNNQPDKISAVSPRGSAFIFDMTPRGDANGPEDYIARIWLKNQGRAVQTIQPIMVSGMQAATASFEGSMNGRQATIRLIAIAFSPSQIARFQVALPQEADAADVDALKRTTYSFSRLSDQERNAIRPDHIRLVNAGPNDTVQTMAARQSVPEYKEDWFRILNALEPGETVKPGQGYKMIVKQ